MKIDFCVPENNSSDLPALLSAIAQGATTQPFDPQAISLLTEFSHLLMHDPAARAHPELVALGFSLRAAEVESLRVSFEWLMGAGRILQPRGIVLQIAAGNGDTLFIHTWIFALLTGNRSVIRLPSKVSPQSSFLCSALNRLLSNRPSLRAANHFIRYSHDREITAALSAACDVRTVWGGDATVNAIRTMPLGPYAKDLAFPDRYSMSAIASEAYLAASIAHQEKLARDFFNDSFWFDQLACSSPRLLIWCGPPHANQEAAGRFFTALEKETVRRDVPVEPSTRMRKFLYTCEAAIHQPITASIERPHFTVLDLTTLEALHREHCGGGLFLQYQTPSLTSIAPHLTRQDQTLTHFGFPPNELAELVRLLNGRALDRIVPIGQALSFGHFWDGYDLLAEFTRSVAMT